MYQFFYFLAPEATVEVIFFFFLVEVIFIRFMKNSQSSSMKLEKNILNFKFQSFLYHCYIATVEKLYLCGYKIYNSTPEH